MLHIKPFDDGGWGDYASYWTYLKTILDHLPANIAAFACDEGNYDLRSPNSLHDAWLKDRIVRPDEIALRFLGPKHDRHILLSYSGVHRSELGLPGDQDDVQAHEIRLVEEGAFAHELLFASGEKIVIEFSGFKHRIELL